mgnify:CR=1 FL=1
MAKRGLGKFVAFAAISGAVAAGVSYVLQYKIYHKELDKDFREFEDEEDDEDDTVQEDTYDPRKLNRNYISLNSSKDEFKMAAKDMAAATKNVLKDAGNLFSDTAHEAVSAAVDTAHIAIHSMKTKKDDLFEADTKKAGDVTEDEFLDDDYVDDDDLYDYARLDRSADEDNGISVSVNADASEELTKEEIYSNSIECQKLSTERAENEEKLEALYERWEELAEEV